MDYVPTAYTVCFSEDQRVFLALALEKYLKDLQHFNPNADVEEQRIFLQMLTELPLDEVSNPNCVHGFCL